MPGCTCTPQENVCVNALRLRLVNLVVSRRAARGARHARRSRSLHKVGIAWLQAQSARIDHSGTGASAFAVRLRSAVPNPCTVLARLVAVRVVRRKADRAEVIRPTAVRDAATVSARLAYGPGVQLRVNALAADVRRVPEEGGIITMW